MTARAEGFFSDGASLSAIARVRQRAFDLSVRGNQIAILARRARRRDVAPPGRGGFRISLFIVGVEAGWKGIRGYVRLDHFLPTFPAAGGEVFTGYAVEREKEDVCEAGDGFGFARSDAPFSESDQSLSYELIEGDGRFEIFGAAHQFFREAFAFGGFARERFGSVFAAESE